MIKDFFYTIVYLRVNNKQMTIRMMVTGFFDPVF